MRDGLLVFDAHTHIAPHPHMMGSRQGYLPTSALVERMDRFGIDFAIVIAHAWAGWTMDDYRREHDEVAEEIAHFRDRLIGICWADPHLGDAALRECERCVRDLHYCALKFHPPYQRFPFDGALMDPFADLARELGVPIIAHLDAKIGGAEPWRMVRLAQRHPDVTFVMAHMGRDLTAIQDGSIARLVSRVPNIVLEASSTTTDGYGVFQQPAEILGPERIIYGSDAAPFHHPAINLIKLEMLDLPRAWRQSILAGAAMAVYRVDPDQFGRAPNIPRGEFAGARGTVTYPCPDPYLTLSMLSGSERQVE